MPQSISLRRSSAARTERAASPAGWIGAVALHAGIIAATLFTWSHSLDIADQSPPVVPVDLVTIGAKTNIAPMVKVQPKEPPKEDVQPPVPEQTQPAPTPAPQKKQEEAAPPPEESPTAEPILKKPPPVVAEKPKPQPEKKKDKFDLDALSALLDKRAPAPSASPNVRVGNRTIKGIGQQNAATADLQSALAGQIMACWSPPVGAPNAQDMIVDFDLFLNRDGSIAQPPQLVGNSAMAAASNPYTRAAAEAARRAIYTCAPYKLPVDRYSQWSEINPFHFDPRSMMGQ